jgi:hypothetical protein
MAPTGLDCEILRPTFPLSVTTFTLVIVLQLIWFYKNAYLAVCLLQLSKNKFNPAIVCSLCLAIASLMEAIRHCIYISRNLPAKSWTVNNVSFGIWLGITICITIIMLTESMLCLAIAWIDVAQKSRKLKSTSSASLTTLKKVFKFFMALLFIVSITMAFFDLTNETAYLGVVVCVLICPILIYGGRELRALFVAIDLAKGLKDVPAPPVQDGSLNRTATLGGDEGGAGDAAVEITSLGAKIKKVAVTFGLAGGKAPAPKDSTVNLSKAVERTYTHLTLTMISFIVSAIWTTNSNQNMYDTGSLGWGGTETIWAVTVVGLSNWSVVRYLPVLRRLQ